MRPLRQIILSLRFLCQTKCLAGIPYTLHKLFCVPDARYSESSCYAKKAVADLHFLSLHCFVVFFSREGPTDKEVSLKEDSV